MQVSRHYLKLIRALVLGPLLIHSEAAAKNPSNPPRVTPKILAVAGTRGDINPAQAPKTPSSKNDFNRSLHTYEKQIQSNDPLITGQLNDLQKQMILKIIVELRVLLDPKGQTPIPSLRAVIEKYKREFIEAKEDAHLALYHLKYCVELTVEAEKTLSQITSPMSSLQAGKEKITGDLLSLLTAHKNRATNEDAESTWQKLAEDYYDNLRIISFVQSVDNWTKRDCTLLAAHASNYQELVVAYATACKGVLDSYSAQINRDETVKALGEWAKERVRMFNRPVAKDEASAQAIQLYMQTHGIRPLQQKR